MIFYTVGTQFPFDRLTRLIDDFAGNSKQRIVGQIGKSNYKPSNFEHFDELLPSDYDRYFNNATLVISHAGMGTILRCLSDMKPIIICPRLAKFGEHRNDHQVDTIERFGNFDGIYTLSEDQDLSLLINSILINSVSGKSALSNVAPEKITNELRMLIES